MASKRKKVRIDPLLLQGVRVSMRQINNYMVRYIREAPGDMGNFDYWSRRCAMRYTSKCIFNEAISSNDPQLPLDYLEARHDELVALLFHGIFTAIKYRQNKELTLTKYEDAKARQEGQDMLDYEQKTGKSLFK